MQAGNRDDGCLQDGNMARQDWQNKNFHSQANYACNGNMYNTGWGVSPPKLAAIQFPSSTIDVGKPVTSGPI